MKNFFYLLSFFYLTANLSATNLSSPIENYVYHHLSQNNPDAALSFLKTLEKDNHPEGLFILGTLYLNGYGVKKNLFIANNYFFRSGYLGFPASFKVLADSYLSGDGVKKCPQLALYYYECAAMRGYGPAQFNAGALLKDGHGTLQPNPQKAYYWLNQAAHNLDLEELTEDAAILRDEIYKN